MTLKGCWRKRNGLITMRCFNGRCPPPAGKVRPGAAGEEEASGWHRGSHLQGNTASLTLPHSRCCTYTRPQSLGVQIICGKGKIVLSDSLILLIFRLFIYSHYFCPFCLSLREEKKILTHLTTEQLLFPGFWDASLHPPPSNIRIVLY